MSNITYFLPSTLELIFIHKNNVDSLNNSKAVIVGFLNENPNIYIMEDLAKNLQLLPRLLTKKKLLLTKINYYRV